jgi:Uri superfamily endonuclease
MIEQGGEASDAAPPALPGGYALELYLEQPCAVDIGRLGRREFPAGIYLYLGSARGPGGLRARLARHLRSPAAIRFHWHIDYLRPFARLVALAWLCEADGAPADLECRWSQALASLPGAVIAVPGFGAADCRSGCPAHLIGFAAHRFAGETDFLRSPKGQALLASHAEDMAYPELSFGVIGSGLPASNHAK